MITPRLITKRWAVSAIIYATLVCRVSVRFFPDGPSSGTTDVCSPMIGLEGIKTKAIKVSKGIPEVVLTKPHGV